MKPPHMTIYATGFYVRERYRKIAREEGYFSAATMMRLHGFALAYALSVLLYQDDE